jgi:alkylhydroperoxidase/carboxymuconolactone decarboxylase family protein YurZ
MAELDARRQKLKADFTQARGYWSALWDGLLELSPDFFEAYLNFSAVPWRSGPLAPKIKELIYVAIDAATTHLYAPGTHIHMRNALGYGATREEIMEVLQLTSVLGIHTITEGVPALIAEMQQAGRGAEVELKPLSPYQERLKAEFTANRGYWSALWDGLLQLSPEFFEAYVQLSSVPWKHGVLEPKIKELIYIAIDASTTHLYLPGLRVHIQNALRHGATVQEILEVMQLTAVLGIHTITEGVPMLLEEVERAAKPAT